MRRITHAPASREACLSRALEYEWLADQAGPGSAYAWDQARLWRSLALVAQPKADDGEARPADGQIT